MEWFKRVTPGLEAQTKRELPDGLWIKCDHCGEVLYKKELERNLFVCTKCEFHFRMDSEQYIALLADEETFAEFNANIEPADPLKFKDSKKYSDRLRDSIAKTGLKDAVRTGHCKVDGIPVVLAAMDFRFIGGSMGSVVGEKISRAIDLALNMRRPMIIISASGGARMQEGALSLMQMAKTSAKLALLSDAHIPYISILTDPTTGGTTASFSMLGDVIIAEPGALIGFAGPRVIKQTIGQDLPEGFQRSEFVMSHGFVDLILPRRELKEQLARILAFFVAPPFGKTGIKRSRQKAAPQAESIAPKSKAKEKIKAKIEATIETKIKSKTRARSRTTSRSGAASAAYTPAEVKPGNRSKSGTKARKPAKGSPDQQPASE